MDICECIVSSRHGGTLNSRRAASPLVRLVEREDRFPPGGATAYQLPPRSINRQVAGRVAKNYTNLAVSPTFRYVSIESPL
ncbi:hypothetical protein TNCV_3772511 [Trichonephila clavipes]|nr:hypothetical protein TNCV_3772511 [Trichonephila clavipes]